MRRYSDSPAIIIAALILVSGCTSTAQQSPQSRGADPALKIKPAGFDVTRVNVCNWVDGEIGRDVSGSLTLSNYHFVKPSDLVSGVDIQGDKYSGCDLTLTSRDGILERKGALTVRLVSGDSSLTAPPKSDPGFFEYDGLTGIEDHALRVKLDDTTNLNVSLDPSYFQNSRQALSRDDISRFQTGLARTLIDSWTTNKIPVFARSGVLDPNDSYAVCDAISWDAWKAAELALEEGKANYSYSSPGWGRVSGQIGSVRCIREVVGASGEKKTEVNVGVLYQSAADAQANRQAHAHATVVPPCSTPESLASDNCGGNIQGPWDNSGQWVIDARASGLSVLGANNVIPLATGTKAFDALGLVAKASLLKLSATTVASSETTSDPRSIEAEKSLSPPAWARCNSGTPMWAVRTKNASGVDCWSKDTGTQTISTTISGKTSTAPVTAQESSVCYEDTNEPRFICINMGFDIRTIGREFPPVYWREYAEESWYRDVTGD